MINEMCLWSVQSPLAVGAKAAQTAYWDVTQINSLLHSKSTQTNFHKVDGESHNYKTEERKKKKKLKYKGKRKGANQRSF